MALKDSDFDYIRDLVAKRTAIVLDTNKYYFVESRLDPIVDELGLKSPAELVLQLRKVPTSSQLHQKITEAITINETSFFRHLPSFRALQDHVIPKLLDSRTNQRELSLWCGACSSGQDPYTIMIILYEKFPQLVNWKLRFVATDISNKILEKAKEGKFSQLEINRGLPAQLLSQYFVKNDLDWQVKPEVRKRIEFRQLNLIESWPPLGKMDIIFLRNVLIYLDGPTKQKVISKAKELMHPDGFMFLGAAEMPMKLANTFEQIPLVRSECYQVKS